MKKFQLNYKVWENAGKRINEKQAKEKFNDPVRIPISVGYRNLDGTWVELNIDHAWTEAKAPGATIVPAAVE